tara:strand:- start:2084 stop:2641 length:558 start_codon:yes stop_codon:yes gene_type:complete
MIKTLYNEIWKQIKGYEGLYEVSNFGRVKSLEFEYRFNGLGFYKKEICIKKLTISYGYPVCNLSKNKRGVVKRVHRLIAEAFIPNPENKPFINHINGIRNDNRLENLEWCTAKENQVHSWEKLGRVSGALGKYNNIKKSKPIKCDTLDIIFPSRCEAQRQLGIDNIARVLKGDKIHIQGLTFRYI